MRYAKVAIALAGIALLAGLAVWAGLPSIENAFVILGFGGFVIILLIHAPLVLLMGLAWWWIGRPHARAAFFVMARLVRDAVAELLPFSQVGGFAAGVRLLSLRGIPVETGSASLFADLLMEFFTKLLYAIAGLGLLVWLRPDRPVPAYLALACAVLGGLVLLAWMGRGLILRTVTRCLTRWRLADVLPSVLVWERLLPSGLLHAICWALGGGEAWVTLHLMGIAVTIGEALVIDSVATSLRTFGFWMPAALGVQEAAYAVAGACVGLVASQALALSLVRRVRDLLLGIMGIGLWQGQEVRHAGRTSCPGPQPDNLARFSSSCETVKPD